MGRGEELATKANLALLETRLEARIEASQNTFLKWLVMLFIAQAGLVAVIVKLP